MNELSVKELFQHGKIWDLSHMHTVELVKTCDNGGMHIEKIWIYENDVESIDLWKGRSPCLIKTNILKLFP